MTAPKTQFGALPLPVIRDDRLQPAHFRALTLVAYFDRGGDASFKGNGRGCYARHRTLAAILQLHEKTVTRLLGELVRWGHLVARHDEGDRRRIIYTVQYATPEWVTRGITNQPEAIDKSVTEAVTNSPEIGNLPAQRLVTSRGSRIQSNQPVAASIINSSEEVIDGVETPRINSVETAALESFEQAQPGSDAFDQQVREFESGGGKDARQDERHRQFIESTPHSPAFDDLDLADEKAMRRYEYWTRRYAENGGE